VDGLGVDSIRWELIVDLIPTNPEIPKENPWTADNAGMKFLGSICRLTLASTNEVLDLNVLPAFCNSCAHLVRRPPLIKIVQSGLADKRSPLVRFFRLYAGKSHSHSTTRTPNYIIPPFPRSITDSRQIVKESSPSAIQPTIIPSSDRHPKGAQQTLSQTFVLKDAAMEPANVDPNPMDPSSASADFGRNESGGDSPRDDSMGPPDGLGGPTPKRRRVTRACDECRRKKIKCDGKQVVSLGTC
jgi:hypothetical protein